MIMGIINNGKANKSILSSSVVERSTVNRLVAGSNPAWGVYLNKKKRKMPSKRYFSVAITVIILIFLGRNVYDHWQSLGTISLEKQSWLFLGMATLVTLLAHGWAGYIWWQTLKFLHQDLSLKQILPVYLKTNVAKYLPGNIWHYYGRVWAVTKSGGSRSAAMVSVLLEPLLMAAAALTIALLGIPDAFWGLAFLGLGMVLIFLHPLVLNYFLGLLQKIKSRVKSSLQPDTEPQLQALGEENIPIPIPLSTTPSKPQLITRYPIFLFLAEIGFLQLRFAGFCLVFAAIAPLPILDLQFLFSAFSLSWLAGLIIPVPAGLGVFESTMLILLQPQISPAVILSVVGLFRLVSILAELVGAGLSWGCDRQLFNIYKK
jgi:glycosyltransferase 2 family protein